MPESGSDCLISGSDCLICGQGDAHSLGVIDASGRVFEEGSVVAEGRRGVRARIHGPQEPALGR